MDLILSEYGKIQRTHSKLITEEDYIINPQIVLMAAVQEFDIYIRGGAVLYDKTKQKMVDYTIGKKQRAQYPYIPTFLALRNKKPLIEIIKIFLGKFDILLIHGAGIHHPRFYGLACEIGRELGLPTIGMTKKSLLGTINYDLPMNMDINEFDIFPVYWNGQILANFLKKKQNKLGIYISVGHMITLSTATKFVTSILRYRFPEPFRILKMLFKRRKAE